MRVATTNAGPSFGITLRLERYDSIHALGQWDMPIELVHDRATVHLDEPVAPHPDLIALAVLLVVGPWVGKTLTLDTAVSQEFASLVESVMGIEIGPVDDDLIPRKAGFRPGVAYSSGPDCLAAEMLMGQDMPLFHFVRRRHPHVPNRSTHLRSDVTLALVEKAAFRGREVSITESDLEFLCRPYPTFGYWVTMTIGLILAADQRNLSAVVFGRHIGGCYVHSGRYFDPDADHDRDLREIFAAVGLDLVIPVSGISEVGTMRIARHHPLFDLAKSCQLGPPGNHVSLVRNASGNHSSTHGSAASPLPSPSSTPPFVTLTQRRSSPTASRFHNVTPMRSSIRECPLFGIRSFASSKVFSWTIHRTPRGWSVPIRRRSPNGSPTDMHRVSQPRSGPSWAG